MARQLRIDHGAIALLLAPTPTPGIVQELRSTPEPHNQVEEGPGGLYETCEALLEDRAEAILEKVRAYPDMKLAPHYDGCSGRNDAGPECPPTEEPWPDRETAQAPSRSCSL